MRVEYLTGRGVQADQLGDTSTLADPSVVEVNTP
jgi:hypothetical protein